MFVGLNLHRSSCLVTGRMGERIFSCDRLIFSSSRYDGTPLSHNPGERVRFEGWVHSVYYFSFEQVFYSQMGFVIVVVIL